MCRCVLVLGVEAPKKSTDANIFGHVVDRDTHEHIPYATIAETGTAFGTTTDASGHYFLKNLPEGALTLEVRAFGYASQTQQVTARTAASRRCASTASTAIIRRSWSIRTRYSRP